MNLSKRAVELPVDDGFVFYHALLGNPTVIPDEYAEKMRSSIGISELESLDPETFSILVDSGLISENNNDVLQHKKAVELQAANACGGKHVKQLDLIVSERCNLGCPHCIYYAGNPRNWQPNTLMDFDVAKKSWEKYLNTVRKNSIKEFQVHFGGAEPLTNWPLIVRVLNEFPKSLKLEESVSWSINTNVTLVNKIIASTLARHSVEVHTSLDGPKEANDAVRMTLGQKGTFKKICEKIDLLRSYGVNISDISTTITDKNFKLIDTRFIDWMQINNIKAVGVDIDLIGFPSLSIKEAVNKLTKIYWACVDRGIECSGTWMTPFLNIVNNDVRLDPVAFCGAVKGRNISVTPSGELTLCAYMESRIGNVDKWEDMFTPDSDFVKLILSRQPGVDDHCKGCMIEGHCGGQCHITREEAERKNDGDIIERMCNFYRMITSSLLIDYANHQSSY